MRPYFPLSLAFTFALVALPATAIAKGNKVSLSPFKITKHYDKASPVLMNAKTNPSPKGPQPNLLESNPGFSTNSPSGIGAPLGGGKATGTPGRIN